jgi:hypothetical protein
MIIGIDFDNTIADYTGVFYNVALALGWLPEHIGQSKNEVKSHFIEQNNEPKWTELQGIVYGKEINKARPYTNCLQVIQSLVNAGHEIHIISHKTLHPIIGEKVNFHTAALNWLEINGLSGSENSPVLTKNIHFNETLQQKIDKIKLLECDVFIDDLIKVINHDYFPKSTKGILFNDSADLHCDLHAKNWLQINALIVQQEIN